MFCVLVGYFGWRLCCLISLRLVGLLCLFVVVCCYYDSVVFGRVYAVYLVCDWFDLALVCSCLCAVV